MPVLFFCSAFTLVMKILICLFLPRSMFHSLFHQRQTQQFNFVSFIAFFNHNVFFFILLLRRKSRLSPLHVTGGPDATAVWKGVRRLGCWSDATRLAFGKITFQRFGSSTTRGHRSGTCHGVLSRSSYSQTAPRMKDW